jgi:hypothetical protein
MQSPRFTIRTLMVAVAVTALIVTEMRFLTPEGIFALHFVLWPLGVIVERRIGGKGMLGGVVGGMVWAASLHFGPFLFGRGATLRELLSGDRLPAFFVFLIAGSLGGFCAGSLVYLIADAIAECPRDPD